MLFSKLSDAWTKDPVKEMSTKLSKKQFAETDTYSDVFNLNYDNAPTSDATTNTNTDISIYTHTPGHTQSHESQKSHNNPTTRLDTVKNPKFKTKKHALSDCENYMIHVKSCKSCNNSLTSIVKAQVAERVDQIILDMKLQQLKDANQTTNACNTSSNPITSYWKEIAILFIGLILIMIIILLIAKSINK